MYLTRCQQDVYDALKALVSDDHTPTWRAIAERAGCHPVTVSRCVHDLKVLGLITVCPINGRCPRYEIQE